MGSDKMLASDLFNHDMEQIRNILRECLKARDANADRARLLGMDYDTSRIYITNDIGDKGRLLGDCGIIVDKITIDDTKIYLEHNSETYGYDMEQQIPVCEIMIRGLHSVYVQELTVTDEIKEPHEGKIFNSLQLGYGIVTPRLNVCNHVNRIVIGNSSIREVYIEGTDNYLNVVGILGAKMAEKIIIGKNVALTDTFDISNNPVINVSDPQLTKMIELYIEKNLKRSLWGGDTIEIYPEGIKVNGAVLISTSKISDRIKDRIIEEAYWDFAEENAVILSRELEE